MKDSDENPQLEVLRKQADYYFLKKLKIHVKTTHDRFYNGFIKEVAFDFFLFEDQIIGEMPVFFLEVIKIEPYSIAIRR